MEKENKREMKQCGSDDMATGTEGSEQDRGDVLILGIEKITADYKKDYLELLDLKRDFGFPLSKFQGRPCISKKTMEKWLEMWVEDPHFPLEKITIKMLNEIEYRRNLSAMEGQRLEGIDVLSRFVRHPINIVLKWSKEENSPIKRKPEPKSGQAYYADSKELLIWMLSMGLRKGCYTPAMRPSIRIVRENGPEYL